MSISGEFLPAVNVDEAVNRIGASWNKATQSIIETASLVLQYTQSAEWIDIREKLIGQKIMSKTVISMLTSIAENPLLTAPENLGRLPASYNTLYQLSKLDGNLPRVFDEGLVTPDLTFEDVLDLRSRIADESGPSKGTGKARKPNSIPFVTIKVPSENHHDHAEELASALSDLQSRFPFIELVYAKK